MTPATPSGRCSTNGPMKPRVTSTLKYSSGDPGRFSSRSKPKFRVVAARANSRVLRSVIPGTRSAATPDPPAIQIGVRSRDPAAAWSCRPCPSAGGGSRRPADRTDTFSVTEMLAKRRGERPQHDSRHPRRARDLANLRLVGLEITNCGSRRGRGRPLPDEARHRHVRARQELDRLTTRRVGTRSRRARRPARRRGDTFRAVHPALSFGSAHRLRGIEARQPPEPTMPPRAH